MYLLAHSCSPKPLLVAKTQLAMLTPYLHMARYPRPADVKETKQHARDAVFQSSTYRKTSRCPLATKPGQETHPRQT
ncbi:uncharacterized protein TRAVEDRAFT_31678 [Trametes versicolor FP-101664 SS1]|uniref:uncharacterized protein n=1 Tax=Trametes versicolor (strain FP-101664) TaxID=717944 RepID=UPI00046238C3|nr:uncharacterized protein TRAVEDRAFT_31678 [Trametes versicolor FP-101664 SS1]EIW53616.1 hypothetical protein TRAVEDRAFT_31678 [Trametes versicolor FP-101664 SS1]